MSTIKNIVFDLGGVIISIDRDRAVERFKEIGVANADELIDPYFQKGIFLEVEDGKIDAETFCRRLSEYTGEEITYQQAEYGWLGFVIDVPVYKLDYLLKLREKYNVYLLSNTNPFIMGWAHSPAFSDAGKPISAYFNKIYASYQMGITKPDPRIFEEMMKDGNMLPKETLFVDDGKKNVEAATALGIHVYQPQNEEDWREKIDFFLK